MSVIIVAPTLTDSSQDATIDYGDVHTVMCRADGEDLEYDLEKEGTGTIFGFQSPGLVHQLLVCCIRVYVVVPSTLRTSTEMMVDGTGVL